MEVSPFYLTLSLGFPCEITGKPPGYIPTIRVGQAFGRMLRMVPGCGAEATEADNVKSMVNFGFFLCGYPQTGKPLENHRKTIGK